jgi:flagellar biosynthesis protein FliR
MFSDLIILYPLLVPFLLVLFRLLGLFAFVPFLSNSSIPGNVKVLLGLAMTFCIWNVVPHVHDPDLPSTLPALVTAVAGEMSIGLLIGLMLGAVFAGIQLGSHMISQQMGLSLATIYDPSFEDQSTVIEQIAFWIALVTFLAMGGHREIITAVVYSYQKVPIGSGGLDAKLMLGAALGSMDSAFHAATRIAMPALSAFFISTLINGLMSRSMPQLNLMTVGITLNLLVGLIMVAVGLAGWATVSHESITDLFHAFARLFSIIQPLSADP